MVGSPNSAASVMETSAACRWSLTVAAAKSEFEVGNESHWLNAVRVGIMRMVSAYLLAKSQYPSMISADRAVQAFLARKDSEADENKSPARC